MALRYTLSRLEVVGDSTEVNPRLHNSFLILIAIVCQCVNSGCEVNVVYVVHITPCVQLQCVSVSGMDFVLFVC